MSNILPLFHVDALAFIMGGLILFVNLCVASFSCRYLSGDKVQGRFYATQLLLVLSVLAFVTADNLFLFLAAWAVSNLLLVKMMIHKSSWQAAKESGRLAFKTMLLAFISLSIAIAVIFTQTGHVSIQDVLSHQYNQNILACILFLILVAACAQSALWPFHKWLLSSLNSPTPVSAIMHAGLINGGGFLLARFAPLYIQQPALMKFALIIGLLTAILGTLWKLVQNDVKRMLACSTMAQMGFMVMQCGLGLFPAAIAHLMWHGFFKSYLFLASGSAAQEKRYETNKLPHIGQWMYAILCTVMGTYFFCICSGISIHTNDTRLFLVGMAFIASLQLSLTILDKLTLKKILLTALSPTIAGVTYGLSVYSFDRLLPGLSYPQSLDVIHYLAFATLAVGWAVMVFSKGSRFLLDPPRWVLGLYVWLLNAGQPHARTITTHRNHYQYQ